MENFKNDSILSETEFQYIYEIYDKFKKILQTSDEIEQQIQELNKTVNEKLQELSKLSHLENEFYLEIAKNKNISIAEAKNKISELILSYTHGNGH